MIKMLASLVGRNCWLLLALFVADVTILLYALKFGVLPLVAVTYTLR